MSPYCKCSYLRRDKGPGGFLTRILFVLLLLFCLSAFCTATETAAPRAARSVHLWYPAEQGVVYYNEVTVEKSYPGSYFCVCGFKHGYFGIQELWEGRKVVLFSVWDPGKQDNPNSVPEDRRVKVLHEGQDVRVSRFGNEGTGGKSMFDYQWNVGETYRCMVKSDGGKWLPLNQATFTADKTPTMNIDAGVSGGRFFLQNGGDTENHTPLRSKIDCPVERISWPDADIDDDWKLLWSDEFNYDGLPDESKWSYETGFIRNREKQYYTNARLENARVEDGTLIIESRKEKYENGDYTSASLNTWHKAEWLYGRIEVRAKLPTGRGMWPAIWMLGTSRRDVGWPACGEIDIMENVGFDPDTICANIHTKAYNHVKGTNKGSKITAEKPYEQYHVYAIEWSAEKLDFFLDDQKYFSFANEGTGNDVWPFDKPHYLILNAAIGGSWGGQKGIDDGIFPQKYCIDYVRVFKKAAD